MSSFVNQWAFVKIALFFMTIWKKRKFKLFSSYICIYIFVKEKLCICFIFWGKSFTYLKNR